MGEHTPDLPARVEEALAKFPPHDGSLHEDVRACAWMDAAQFAGNLFPALAADWKRLRERERVLTEALTAIAQLDYTRAAVNGAAWRAVTIARAALTPETK